jgi:hypothetical protein
VDERGDREMIDFAKDMKEMMDKWTEYRNKWIEANGNDDGFSLWFEKQLGL